MNCEKFENRIGGLDLGRIGGVLGHESCCSRNDGTGGKIFEEGRVENEMKIYLLLI